MCDPIFSVSAHVFILLCFFHFPFAFGFAYVWLTHEQDIYGNVVLGSATCALASVSWYETSVGLEPFLGTLGTIFRSSSVVRSFRMLSTLSKTLQWFLCCSATMQSVTHVTFLYTLSRRTDLRRNTQHLCETGDQRNDSCSACQTEGVPHCHTTAVRLFRKQIRYSDVGAEA